jgi:hypothetical protein
MRFQLSAVCLLTFCISCVACGGGGGGGASIVSATPSPTNQPTNQPEPVSVSPDGVQLLAVPSSAIVTASEPNYTGSFTAQSLNTGIATVASGPGAEQFTINAVAPGFTKIEVSDPSGNSTSAPISVTTTGVGGN